MASHQKAAAAGSQSRYTPSGTPDIENDRIARRAYERYEARGRENGRDLDDWYEAEQELRRHAGEHITERAEDSDRD